MSRYFFHLIDSIDVVLDPEGVEMPAKAVVGAAQTSCCSPPAGEKGV